VRSVPRFAAVLLTIGALAVGPPRWPRRRTRCSGAVSCACLRGDSKAAGVAPVTVGELDLKPHWGGQFNYTNTNTSTVEVGFRFEGEGGWSGGGSTTFAKAGSSESINPIAADPVPRHIIFRADMVFRTFRLECEGRTAYMLEPTEWTGGMRPEWTTGPRCDKRFLASVGPNASYARQVGSSQSFSGAFSIAGFIGGASSANSRSVRHEWRNSYPQIRNLCGVSDLITKDTRVVSFS